MRCLVPRPKNLGSSGARIGTALFVALAWASMAPAAHAADRSSNVLIPGNLALPATPSTVDPNPPIAGRVDPATYRVGPGDEFALRYSDLLDPRIVRVGPAGDLVLPDVGAISVAGLTLTELESRVRERMRPYVRGRGFSFSLHRPRRFRLLVAGEIERPGTVTLQAPVRASEAIEAAGGVAKEGARRGIQIRRGSDTLWVDLVFASRGGNLEADPLVFESDVVFVPPAGRWVEIHGAVSHPGRYDFVPGDRLRGLVALAGGLLPEAAPEEASLERFDQEGRSEHAPVRIDRAVDSPKGAEDALLREGDRLFVPGRPRWLEGEIVEVEGEVRRPGPYPIRGGVDRVRSLLERAGGWTESADTAAVRVERLGDSVPRDSVFLALAAKSPELLTSEDREYVVTVAKERRAASADVGRLLARNDERGNVLLYDKDRIVVPRSVSVVSVQGEVVAPGYVPYSAGRRASEYVKEAGGYTSRANKGRVLVTLASTGRPVSASDAGALRPGDTIWVPAKERKSAWSQIRDVLTTAAQAATIYLVVREATK